MRVPILLLLVLIAAFAGGCQPAKPPVGTGMDMFAPVAMRIHPLTRGIVGPAGEVEARLEFTDALGDVGKGVGAVYFELYPYEIAASDHKGPRLGLWNSTLATPDANREHWDRVTRTYLFHLGVPDSASVLAGKKFIVSATFVPPHGPRLIDNFVLTVR